MIRGGPPPDPAPGYARAFGGASAAGAGGHGGHADAARAAGAGRFELLRALASLSEAPEPSQASAADALGLPGLPLPEEHTAVLVLQCHPYASFYLSRGGMLGGEASDRVAGFWRALGLVPPAEPDHLAALFGLYAALGIDALDHRHSDATRAGLTRARKTLLWEHIASWVPAFLAAVSDVGTAWFQAWAALVAEALAAETEAAGAPSRLPLALRQAPEPMFETGVPEAVDSVLAPALRPRPNPGAAHLGFPGDRRRPAPG